MPAISIVPERCTGCHSCEMVCSLAHEGSCSSLLSRIRMKKWEEISVFMPVVCQHCEKPPCMTICPTGARKRVPETDAVITIKKGVSVVSPASTLVLITLRPFILSPNERSPVTCVMVSLFVQKSVRPEHSLIFLKETSRWREKKPSEKFFFNR